MDREAYRLRLFILGTALLAVYFFVFGESGFLERIKLEKERKTLQGRIAELERANTALAGALRLYRGGHMGREDFVRTGYVSPGERLVYFQKRPGETENTVALAVEEKPEQLPDIHHLRILWGVVAAMVLLVYGARARRHLE